MVSLAAEAPFLKSFPIIKGLLGGMLLAGALLTSHGLIIQGFLFIVTLLVFIDASCSFGSERHIVAFISMYALGLGLGIISMLFGAIDFMVAAAFLLLFFLYTGKYVLLKKH